MTATIMVIGQDWGGVPYFLKHQGRDEPTGNRTNENLELLLRSIGFESGNPGNPADSDSLFFSNLILCLKQGALQAAVKPVWFRTCARNIFRELLDIVQPAVVVAMGLHAARTILEAYGMNGANGMSLTDLVAGAPYALPGTGSVVFPVFHCGARGVNQNRPMSRQIDDWARIGAWVRKREQRGSE
ncbi:MAG: uracil-DNA glycosylase family protein [Candidatus Krumholzibacteriia bacterium]